LIIRLVILLIVRLIALLVVGLVILLIIRVHWIFPRLASYIFTYTK
jgi:hypothetical protein